MRKHYTASYLVGRLHDEGPGIEKVSAKCLDWIGSKVALPKDGLAAGVERARTHLTGGAWVETIRVDTPERSFWGMRYGHPDFEDDSVEWHTEMCVSHNTADGQTAFGCTLLVGTRAGHIAPARPPRSRPRIVRDVLRAWGGHHGFTLSADPLTLHENDADNFITLLRSPDRSRPVVVVSPTNKDASPIVDIGKLADWLCGVAHVVVEAPGCSRALETRLPRRLNCWDGAVRVYWPGFTLNDEPYKHRHWPPWEIQNIERRLPPHGFTEHVLGWLSDIAVFTADPAVPSWTELEILRRGRLIEEARRSGNQDELLDMAFAEIADKDKRIQELQGEVEQIRADLQDARAQKESYEQAYRHICQGAVQAPPSGPAAVPLATVAEALGRAQATFEGRLVLALNGQSDGDASIFEHPTEVFDALEFLATVYHDARTGAAPCNDFDLVLREANGWRYLGRHSDLTINKYENWYTTRWDQRRHVLTEHLGTGSSKDPRRTMRIGFCWDEDQKVVVVGFLGQHQKTDAT